MILDGKGSRLFSQMPMFLERVNIKSWTIFDASEHSQIMTQTRLTVYVELMLI